MKQFLLLLCLLGYLSAFSQPNIKWEKNYGGSANDYGTVVIENSVGNYLFFGATSSSDIDVSNKYGNRDVWVAEIDPATQNIIWEKNYGSNDNEYLMDVLEIPDGYFLLCYGNNSGQDVSNHYGTATQNDIWLVKIDFNGNIIWEKNYGGSYNDYGSSIKQTGANKYTIVGSSHSNDFDVSNHYGSTNLPDIWLLEIDTAGAILREKSFGSTSSEAGYELVQYLNGYALIGVTGDQQNNDRLTTSLGNSDYWVLRLDSAWNIIWEKSYGGSSDDAGRTIGILPNNNLLISGISLSADNDVSNPLGNRDVWILEIDSMGDIIWEKSYGSSTADGQLGANPYTNRSVLNIGNSIYFSLRSIGNDMDLIGSYGVYDFWVFKTDLLGNIIWKKNYGGTHWDLPTSLYFNNNQELLLIGYSRSTNIDITNNYGLDDIWLVNLESECIDSIGAFWVKNPNDSGPGSLREAINCANSNTGPDTIRFNFQASLSGSDTIFLMSELPTITDDSLVIDLTRDGYAVGDLVIEGDGTFDGLIIDASTVKIQGLHFDNHLNGITAKGKSFPFNSDITIGGVTGNLITNYKEHGIFIDGNSIDRVFGVNIWGNKIGTNDGFQKLAIDSAIGIKLSYAGNVNVGNSTNLNTGNQIIGGLIGIELERCSQITLSSNIIGFNASLSDTFHFGSDAISFEWSSNIHFMAAGAVNHGPNHIIAGPNGNGIRISRSHSISCTGAHYIGSNNFNNNTCNNGIFINNVGDLYCQLSGFEIYGANQWGINAVNISDSTEIKDCLFFCNNLGGINYDNTSLSNSKPTITNGDLNSISGMAAPGELVQVYISDNSTCSQYNPCQGNVILGSAVANSLGNWTLNSPYSATLAGGDSITALAIDSMHSSAFASCYPIVICNLSTYVQSQSNATCNANDGSVTIAQTGGVSPITFTLGGVSQSSNVFSNLNSGSYSVFVQDGNGCLDTVNVNIGVNNVTLSLSGTNNNATCGQSNGSITAITSSNGIGTLSFSINTGQTAVGNGFYNLAPGNYTVTVTDSRGCVGSAGFTIGNTNYNINFNTTAVAAHCTQSNGLLTVNSITGGSTPYSYSRGGAFQSSSTFTNLAGGNYTITVRDANGCQKSIVSTVNIYEPSIHSNMPTSNNATCTASNGSIILSPSSGLAPYRVRHGANAWQSWGNYTITGLSSANYTVYVEDFNGCDTNFVVFVGANTGNINANFSLIDSATCAAYDGSIVINAGGGSAPYSFSWNGGAFQSSNTLNSINSGNHFYTVRDNNGCQFIGNFNMPQKENSIQYNLSVTPDTCGAGLGVLSIANIMGGNVPYQASIGTGFGSNTVFSNLLQGWQTVWVKDVNGCEKIDSIVVPLLNYHLKANFSFVPSLCATATGIVTVNLNNSSLTGALYSEDGISFSANNVFTNVPSGIKQFFFKDSKGCEGDTMIFVPNTAANINNTFTYNFNSAGVEISINTYQGIAPFTYLWSTGSTGALVNGLQFGNTYWVKTTDGNMCSRYDTITITLTSLEDDLNENEVVVSPNPSNGLFNIAFLNSSLIDQSKLELNVFNISGKEIENFTISQTKNNIVLDMSNNAKGIYLLEIKEGPNNWIKKLVKD